MLKTDYLIVGAGALGMSFADQLLTETDSKILFVDKHHLPGGHWNNAYSFVCLHQPSAFYGVGSRDLGSNRIDETGVNRGYYELASGAEIQTYFERLMRERFLPSGRVEYFPMCEYTDNGSFTSLLSGETQSVEVRRKVVDATFFNTSVPSTRTPKYEIADGVKLIAPNSLPTEVAAHSRYTIIGGGKTAMDVAMWLLQNGAKPGSIRWVVPRDSWLINRETTQPGDAFHNRFIGAKAAQLESCANATSIAGLFDLLEQSGQLLRIDKSITPTMYHGATIAQAEIDALGTIRNVIRKGHVQQIGLEKMILDDGEVISEANDLYIDCTASAIVRRPTRPIFAGNSITLQMIRAGLFCFSAAVIAHLESTTDDDAQKNHLCPPLQAPDADTDWLLLMKAETSILKRWSTDASLRQWISQHRLGGANLRSKLSDSSDPQSQAIRARIKAASSQASENLDRLISQIGN
jgi:hypothetical protein